MPPGRDHDVGGLDVSMDNSLRVGGIEGIGKLDGHLKKVIWRKWASRHAGPNIGTLEQLHHDVRPALVFSNVEYGAHVGMVQRRCGSGLTLETLEREPILPVLVWQEFESDLTFEAWVFRLVHNTHPTTAQVIDDLVVGHRLPDHLFPRTERRPRLAVSAQNGQQEAGGDRGTNDAGDVRPHGMHQKVVVVIGFQSDLVDDAGSHRDRAHARRAD